MRVNTRKHIIDRIDAAIEAQAGAVVESIELNKEERHELYKSGSARFRKSPRAYGDALRGSYFTTFGRWVEVYAEEEC